MIDEWKKGAKYWDHAWNPVIGCRKASEGCANCYAARLAAQYPELQDDNGGFEPHPPKNLKNPPKKGVVFCGNMTDLFGDWNSDEQIRNWLKLLAVRGDLDNAEYLILTKRTARLAGKMSTVAHFGMTAENQQRYDERISDFRCFEQSGVPWLSAEPLLGPIDMGLRYIAPEDMPFRWVVVGAESGPNRRPCKIEWVRHIVRECRLVGVRVFVKQLDLDGKLEKDIAKFPEDLQIRQVPWSEWREW